MSEPGVRINRDDWLAGILGQPVFRVDAAGLGNDPTSLGALAAHTCQQDQAFYYAKLDSSGVEDVRRLGSLGFFVADTNVLFQLDRLTQLNLDFPGITIGEPRPEDADAVLAVAGSAFRNSRFHLDPWFGPELAHAIKRSWCASYLSRQRGDRLFVAKLEGKVAGFLAALTDEAHGQRRAVIDLVGVAPAFQRRRVGAALTTAFVEHYRNRASALQVGTQVANIPSIRLYERCGFSLSSSQYVLHLHTRAGSPRS